MWYDEIYKIFNNEEFTLEDEYLDAYYNIKRSGIHAIAARPIIFPYNYTSRWCFTHIDEDTTTIMNESRIMIASLKP
jgi:hypothetical protein